jgi:hypothetical protein
MKYKKASHGAACAHYRVWRARCSLLVGEVRLGGGEIVVATDPGFQGVTLHLGGKKRLNT